MAGLCRRTYPTIARGLHGGPSGLYGIASPLRGFRALEVSLGGGYRGAVHEEVSHMIPVVTSPARTYTGTTPALAWTATVGMAVVVSGYGPEPSQQISVPNEGTMGIFCDGTDGAVMLTFMVDGKQRSRRVIQEDRTG